VIRFVKTLSVSLALVLALAFAAPVAAAGVPSSPGACHMTNASPEGISGMHQAAEHALEHMMDLVIASFQAGCTP